MASAIIAFLYKLLTGQLWAAWQAHKVERAQNAQNDVAAMSDSELDNRVRDDITRK